MKKLKKNTFIQGTLITSIILIIIKILGALYVIPFYKIIGSNGGTLYSYAYNIYNLFLNISTAGIPVAIAMIISEYLALNMDDAKERAYKIGKKIILILSLVSFLIVFLGADVIAKFIISDVSGGNPVSDIAYVIRAMSFCLIIIPFLSALRGYLQGHKYVVPTSYSQLIEQVVRIFVVIFGSYLVIKVFKKPINVGVAVSLLGAFIGGLAAYIYLSIKVKNNKSEFPISKKKDIVSNKVITKKILSYCIPLIIISVVDNLYTIVDVKLIIKGLNMVGYSAIESEMMSGIVSTWAPKICTIIVAIATALTTNIIPHVTSSFIKKDMKEVNRRFNQAISTMLLITIPMALMLLLLSNEGYFIFYGESNYGPLILKVSAVSHVFFGIWSVINTCLQSMRKFKIVYINSVAGLVANAILDIPLILLFNKIGLPAYIATIVSTCIGYFISIIIALIYLKKNMNFSYKISIETIKKMILPTICLFVPILLSKIFIKFDYNYITSFVSLFIHGMYGTIIYLVISYKNGLLFDTLGRDAINNILSKFHIKVKE
jgi:O-antigen/teichoic acid export membrane protein